MDKKTGYHIYGDVFKYKWNTSDTKRMAQAMMLVMTRPNTGILHSLVSFTHSTVYDSVVQDRPGTAQMTEHSKAISESNPVGLKYRGMKAAGGAAAWYFIPVVGGTAVPKRQLESLQNVEIGSHSNSWNNAGKKHRPKLRANKPHRPKALHSHTTRVVRFEAYTLQGGQMTMGTDSDMLVQSKRFLLHSSRAHNAI